MFAINICGDRHASAIIMLFWCSLSVHERSPIELTVGCRVARCFCSCSGPTAVIERAFLSVKFNAIGRGLQGAKNETIAPTCATPLFAIANTLVEFVDILSACRCQLTPDRLPRSRWSLPGNQGVGCRGRSGNGHRPCEQLSGLLEEDSKGAPAGCPFPRTPNMVFEAKRGGANSVELTIKLQLKVLFLSIAQSRVDLAFSLVHPWSRERIQHVNGCERCLRDQNC